MDRQKVILVDMHDKAIGVADKMPAHEQGLLHRAFSVFIFDSQGKMLLQQRALNKYHGAHLWTNACCSHPFPEEDVKSAAERRVKEELGFSISLNEIFSFTYKANVENNLIEHEYDHVFTGVYGGVITPEPSEVADYKYESMDAINNAVKREPEKFTSWFKIAFPMVEKWYEEGYSKTEK